MRIESDKAVEELEGYMQGNAMASYVHLHFGSNPTVAPAFVERCRYISISIYFGRELDLCSAATSEMKSLRP